MWVVLLEIEERFEPCYKIVKLTYRYQILLKYKANICLLHIKSPAGSLLHVVPLQQGISQAHGAEKENGFKYIIGKIFDLF